MSVDWKAHYRRVVETLGEDVTYTPAGGTGAAIRGIFADPPREVLVIESHAPEIACVDDDVPAVEQGDAFIIRGATYKVKSVRHDSVMGRKVMGLEVQ